MCTHEHHEPNNHPDHYVMNADHLDFIWAI